MSGTNQARATNLWGVPSPGETAQTLMIDPGRPAERKGARAGMKRIAEAIGKADRPLRDSEIPAGVTCLTQLAALDLEFPAGEAGSAAFGLDLSVIYGRGPVEEARFYQTPPTPGSPRYLLLLNRTRGSEVAPPLGAERDMPRIASAQLELMGLDPRTHALVPNPRTDSNLLLGQTQTLWALLHNAIAATLVAIQGQEESGALPTGADPYGPAYVLARRITQSLYRDVLIHDVLRAWMLPEAFASFEARGFAPKAVPRRAAPLAEFLAGVAPLAQTVMRDAYSINAARGLVSTRDILRQTSAGRPMAMPLTEDWLVDFCYFFSIGGSCPQMARAIGPHVARAFAPRGSTAWQDGAPESLLLDRLAACSDGSVRSVASLAGLVRETSPELLSGRFAGDDALWQSATSDWLARAGFSGAQLRSLAQEPPLMLFLMLEAEADTGGARLGALGSIIMGETFAAALPPLERNTAFEALRRRVFGGRVPDRMSTVIEYLQAHYGFADGARLHGGELGSVRSRQKVKGGYEMLDERLSRAELELESIRVIDHVEMGRLVTDWATGQRAKPGDAEELRRELRGIAEVPERITRVEFAQGDRETLVIQLPEKDVVEKAVEEVSDPEFESAYPFPLFYSDFFRPSFCPVMSPLDILMARLGDQTIAQCR